VEQEFLERTGQRIREPLAAARQRLTDGNHRLASLESEHRYRWGRSLLENIVVQPQTRQRTWTEKLDAVLTHRVFGLVFFVALMFVIFQAIFHWAGPAMDACETAQGWVSEQVEAVVAPGPLRSLLV